MANTRMRATQAYNGPVVDPMGTFNDLSSYYRAVDTTMKQDRAHELNMRELEFQAARKALGLDTSGANGKANDLADKFLNSWNQYMTDAKGIYNQALQGFNEGYDFLRDANKSVDALGDIGKDVEADLDTFRQQFGPLQSEMVAGSREYLQNQREMGAQMKDLAKADYEGVAGRAMADVSQQAEIGRQAEARRMAALGQDPTTMRSRANSANMITGEATGKAVAANLARRGEKERVTGITGQAFQLFDPTKLSQSALAIRQSGDALQGLRANLATAGLDAKTKLATTWGNMATAQGNIGGDIATKIGSQYGDMAGLFSGINYAANQSVPNFPTSSGPSMPSPAYVTSSGGGSSMTTGPQAYETGRAGSYAGGIDRSGITNEPAYMNYSLPKGSYFNM